MRATQSDERVTFEGQPSTCQRCGAHIRWCRTRNAKRIAMQFRSSEFGDYVVSGRIDGVDVVSLVPKGVTTDLARFDCHFDLCASPNYATRKSYKKRSVDPPARRQTHRYEQSRRDLA